MIWLLIWTYALAGLTIGRMAWEFDAFKDDPKEKLMCWVTAILWPLVPALGLWAAVRGLRR